MLVFAIYLILISGLIWLNGFFRFFNDEKIGNRKVCFVFILKAAAVPLFYYLFKKMYGGIEHLDAGKFYHDATVLNGMAYSEPLEFLKAMLGLQDDTGGSWFYKEVGLRTDNWDNGDLRDFFYNDNRVVIRIHALFHFIAFNSYFAHALFNCFFGFVGSFLIYRTFRNYFAGKEFLLLIIICFFPTLWFYSGAVLKESFVLLLLGCNLYFLKTVFEKGFNWKRVFILLFLLYLSLLLKPYITFYAALFFALGFWLQKYYRNKGRIFVFAGCLLLVTVVLNLVSISVKHKSLAEAAFQRKQAFADMSYGGIFLCDTTTWDFARLEYDYDLVKKVNDTPAMYCIRKGVSYRHWEFTHQQDTLEVKSNSDTLTRYKLMYDIPKAGSNFDVGNATPSNENLLGLAVKGFYNSLRHPFFFDAKGAMQWLASFENFLLLVCIVLVLSGIFLKPGDQFQALVMFLFGVSLFSLIGFTTPNTGAMLRYRSPAAIFIMMSALFYFDFIIKKIRTSGHTN